MNRVTVRCFALSPVSSRAWAEGPVRVLVTRVELRIAERSQSAFDDLLPRQNRQPWVSLKCQTLAGLDPQGLAAAATRKDDS